MRIHNKWNEWDENQKQKYVDGLERQYPQGHPYSSYQNNHGKSVSRSELKTLDRQDTSKNLISALQDKKTNSEEFKAFCKDKKIPSKEELFRNPPNFKVPRGSNSGRNLNLNETADNDKVAVYLMEPGRSEIVKDRNHLEGNEMCPDYVVYHYHTALARKQTNPHDPSKREVIISCPNYKTPSDTQLINEVLSQEFSGRVSIKGNSIVDNRTGNRMEFNGLDVLNVSRFLEGSES